MASLWVTNGPLAGQSVRVTGELVIGRENADLQVSDPEVSRRHAVVRLISGALEVEDLGSSNGTFVNDARITGSVRVGGGARIRVGKTEFEVRGVVPAKSDDVAPVQGTHAAAPIADPQTTKAASTIDPDLTRVRPALDPQVTAARPVVDPQVTAARSIPDPPATSAPPVAGPQVTRARAVPDDPPRAQASSESVLDTSRRAPGPAKEVAAQVGAFSPPARRRGRGLNSRRWVPTVAAFGTAAAAAAALIVYYVVHGVPG
jgi:pSer/pThr/pTyr-binding forkhead associated (FHA) protein